MEKFLLGMKQGVYIRMGLSMGANGGGCLGVGAIGRHTHSISHDPIVSSRIHSIYPLVPCISL